MSDITVPETPNVSLVAFYEKNHKPLKSTALRDLVRQVQQHIQEILWEMGLEHCFVPYALEQVHATILGLEGAKTKSGIISKWFLEKRGQSRYLELDKLLNHFRWHANLPVVVRFCAFFSGADYGFISQQQHPFQRSFQIREDRSAILMGWPSRGDLWPQSLDQLRLGAQKFNLLHKYHHPLDAVDNDCYLRVGRFTELPSSDIRYEIERQIRNRLAAMPPVYEMIDHTNLVLVRYQEPTLRLDQTQSWSLDDLSAEQLQRLYPDAQYSG